MEGKSVIVSVLLVSLMISQIQVEAKICCPSTTARNIYNVCLLPGYAPKEACAALAQCKIMNTCQPPYDRISLESNGDVANKYCKLGCEFSVCSEIATLQNFDSSEVVNGVAERCTNVCAALCAKGSNTALAM